MPNKADTDKLRASLEQVYSATRKEQRIDQDYYDDVFVVPQVKAPLIVSRTGRGSRMVDSPAEHIITSNPQAYREPIRNSTAAKDGAIVLSSMVNHWLSVMSKMNPNPFKEFVKNLLLRGEAWIRLMHNEKFITQNGELPILFFVPDPMTIWASPKESVRGVPEKVIVQHERMMWVIEQIYPQWKNPLQKEPGQAVLWVECWDSKGRYFEADGVTVLETPNIYKLNPFVHSLSGFGKESPEGKMESLIVGRLRKVRHLLDRDAAITSSVDNIIHQFANHNIDVQGDDDHPVHPDFAQNYQAGYGKINILDPGIKVTPSVKDAPDVSLFQWADRISAQLAMEDPMVLAGLPGGESGRQQDMMSVSAMRRYETIVENTENAFATAIGMALQMIETIPGYMPTGMKKEYIGGNYDVRIELKVADQIEDDRKATLGSRLYQQGEIDLRKNLIKYQGCSAEEADDIIDNILVDRVMLFNPEIAEILGLKLAEKTGMKEVRDMVRQRRQQLETQQQGLMKAPSSSEMTQRAGETKTPLGREMADTFMGNSGQRQSPAPYTRGQ